MKQVFGNLPQAEAEQPLVYPEGPMSIVANGHNVGTAYSNGQEIFVPLSVLTNPTAAILRALQGVSTQPRQPTPAASKFDVKIHGKNIGTAAVENGALQLGIKAYQMPRLVTPGVAQLSPASRIKR